MNKKVLFLVLSLLSCNTYGADDAQQVCEREISDWRKYYKDYEDLKVYHYLKMGNIYDCLIKAKNKTVTYSITLRLTYNSNTNRRAVFETGY